MTTDKLSFVSFEPRDGRFVAFVAVDYVFSGKKDTEAALAHGSKVYKDGIKSMRSLVAEIDVYRTRREIVSARTVWRLGDALFRLVQDLEKLAFQLDGFYEHLTRDLNVKRKWLEKVIILRRYIAEEAIIPETLGWGHLEKGTRRKARELVATFITKNGQASK